VGVIWVEMSDMYGDKSYKMTAGIHWSSVALIVGGFEEGIHCKMLHVSFGISVVWHMDWVYLLSCRQFYNP